MRYVIAGYVFVLGFLALYAVALMWRRIRLTRAVARVTGPDVTAASRSGVATIDGPGAAVTAPAEHP